MRIGSGTSSVNGTVVLRAVGLKDGQLLHQFEEGSGIVKRFTDNAIPNGPHSRFSSGSVLILGNSAATFEF